MVFPKPDYPSLVALEIPGKRSPSSSSAEVLCFTASSPDEEKTHPNEHKHRWGCVPCARRAAASTIISTGTAFQTLKENVIILTSPFPCPPPGMIMK